MADPGLVQQKEVTVFRINMQCGVYERGLVSHGVEQGVQQGEKACALIGTYPFQSA